MEKILIEFFPMHNKLENSEGILVEGQFRHDGRYHFVGNFTDEVEAARAYDSAIAPLAGEFARINFPKAA